MAKPVEPGKWFRSGWSHYAGSFPEYSETASNFLRPVVNACYYGNYLAWGEAWGRYLFLNFAVVALGTALCYHIARGVFGCGPVVSLLAAGVALFNPALRDASSSPIEIINTLSSLLAVCAFLFIVHRRAMLAIPLLVVALFVKEAAAFAPFAAAVSFLVLRRHDANRLTARDYLMAIALVAIPIGIWQAARWTAFHGSLDVYVTRQAGVKGLALNCITCVLQYPLGLQDATDPTEALRGILYRNWGRVALLPMLALVVNGIAALAMLAVAVRLAFRPAWRRQNEWLLWYGPWLALSLAMPVGLGLPVKNCYDFYLLLTPVTAMLAVTAWKNRRPGTIALVAASVLVTIIPTAQTFLEEQTAGKACAREEMRRMAESLVEALVQAGKSHERIYLANDIPVRHAGKSIAAFARCGAEVVVLNNVELPTGAAVERESLGVKISKLAEHRYLLEMQVAEPGTFVLPGVSRDDLHLTEGNASVRNRNIRYEFAAAKPGRIGFLGTLHWQAGNLLRVLLTDDKDFAIVDLDAVTKQYRTIELPR
ncbi:MAG: hypothetical protein ABSG68_03655 [Thermoguttaceae bacterium]